MADILPGYQFDNGRYRDQATGKFVSRAAIMELLDALVQGAEKRFTALATAFYDGRLAAAAWVEQTASEIRRLALQSAALARGGWDRLVAQSFALIGQALGDTYRRIIGTGRDVIGGLVSLPQLINRVTGYVGRARRIFFQTADPGQAPPDMTRIQRRLLAPDAQHCVDCPGYYDQGWQPLGVLPTPGERCKCGDHCRCTMIERDVLTSDLADWLGTKR